MYRTIWVTFDLDTNYDRIYVNQMTNLDSNMNTFHMLCYNIALNWLCRWRRKEGEI